jgi:hypothetical protein
MKCFLKHALIASYLLFTFIYQSFAQETNPFTIKISEARKLEKEANIFFDSDDEDLLGFSSDSLDNIYLLKSVPQKQSKYDALVADIYSPDLKFLNSKVIKLPAEAESTLELQGLYTINNKPILFYSQYNKKTDKKNLYYSVLGLGGKLEKNSKLLTFETTSKYKGDFDVFYSLDSSKFMILVETPQKFSENVNVKCYVFDKYLNKLNQYDVKFDHPKHKLFYKWELTNNGIPLALIHYPRKEKRKEYGNYVAELRMYSSQSKPDIYNLDIKNKVIRELKIASDDGKMINLLGTYGPFKKGTFLTADKAKVCGTAFIKIDLTTRKLVKSKLNIFSKPVLDFFGVDPEKIDTKGEGVSYLQTKFSSMTANKVPFVVLEQSFSITTTTRTTSTTTYYNTYKILAKYDNDGNVKFERIVECLNKSTDIIRGLNSHVYSLGENIGLVYNINEANLDKSNNEGFRYMNFNKGMFSKIDNSATIATTFDEKGAVTKTPLFSFKKDHIYLDGANIFYNQNYFIVSGTDGKNYKVAKLTFNK